MPEELSRSTECLVNMQISAASTVSGLEGEVMTLKRCLVPRAFFKRSSKDKAKQQASYAARVLAREYSA